MTVRFSIITPCLNGARTVEGSIQSVLRQGYAAFEHIIIDGGSTDETLEILARYPHLKVVSEKDNGMYDALNKGLQLASGEILGFLNADDLFAEHILKPIADSFHNENLDAVTGKAQIFEEREDGSLRIVLELSPSPANKLVGTAITGSTIFNAWFFRRSILHEVGGFDSQYRISGDADLLLRLALMGMNYLALDSVHYLYRQHEGSLTFQLNSDKLLRAFKDHSLFIRKYVSSAEIPDDVKAQFSVLYSNTCLALSRQYQKEGKRLQAFVWKLRASFDIPLPVLRYLAC